MYMDYSNLMKLLIDKGLNKTDVCNMTGISTRTMAKLSKNESVNTDTLLLICKALNCDISDIATAKSGEVKLTPYEAYRNNGKVIREDEISRDVAFDCNGVAYKVRYFKRKAHKHMTLQCSVKTRTVTCVEVNMVGIHQTQNDTPVCNYSFIDRDAVCILLLNGNPGTIVVPERKLYRSIGDNYEPGDLYIMTTAEFKSFGRENA